MIGIFGWPRLILLLGFAVALFGAMFYGIDRNEKNCAARGGHSVQTAAAHFICVSDDGRVLQ